eukprot:scaffold102_cov340-Pavlova_lutheri.AAC.78
MENATRGALQLDGQRQTGQDVRSTNVAAVMAVRGGGRETRRPTRERTWTRTIDTNVGCTCGWEKTARAERMRRFLSLQSEKDEEELTWKMRTTPPDAIRTTPPDAIRTTGCQHREELSWSCGSRQDARRRHRRRHDHQ